MLGRSDERREGEVERLDFERVEGRPTSSASSILTYRSADFLHRFRSYVVQPDALRSLDIGFWILRMVMVRHSNHYTGKRHGNF